MKEATRYKLSQRQDISSLADIRAFARDALLEDGIDIDIVNISEESVKINSFKKLVKRVYDLGFKEGTEQYATIRGQKKIMEREGKILTKYQRLSKFMAENNQINKI